MRVQRRDTGETRRVETRRGKGRRGAGARPTSRWDRARTPPNLGRPLSPLIIRLPSRDVSHLPRRWCALAHRRAHTDAFTCTDAGDVDDAVLHHDLGGVRYARSRFPEFDEDRRDTAISIGRKISDAIVKFVV